MLSLLQRLFCVPAVCGSIALCTTVGIVQTASAGRDSAGELPTYAVVDWPDPLNPEFVKLGGDQYLLSTAQGMQIWDVAKNLFSESQGWPIHSSLLDDERSSLAGGTLLGAQSHSDNDEVLQTLVWWNPQTKVFAATLPLPQMEVISEIVEINDQLSLVCSRTGFGTPRPTDLELLPTKAALVAMVNGKLQWQANADDSVRAALFEASIEGVVQGIGRLDQSLSTVKQSPVFFNTETCRWEMRHLPPEMAAGKDLRIKHHRLPDGRLLVSQAEWYSPRELLSAPLLWDEAKQLWSPITPLAQESNSPGSYSSYSINDPVVSVPAVDAEFVEFLDPRTLRWIRSKETLPDTYSPTAAPLSSGAAILFLREGGRIIVVNPQHETPPNRFVYSHWYFGDVALKKGGLLLLNENDSYGRWKHRSELLRVAKTPSSSAIAPLPAFSGDASGLELQDGTILVFGGLPSGCGASFFTGPCTENPAQASYRYFPQQNRWDVVADLALRFSNGQFLDSVSDHPWPRGDAIVRRNSDFVALDGPSNLKHRDDNDNSTLLTTPIRWRPGTKPTPLAPLRRGRTHATLLELADQRLAVIGGRAQQHVVALEKQCFDCPDEFASVGKLEWTRSTETYDDKTATWAAGPLANYAGGRAVKLGNGRVFKLSLTGLWNADDGGYSAEIADAEFTHWDKLPPFPLESFKAMRIAVIGNRVLILPQYPDRRQDPPGETVVWNDDSRTWSVWAPWTKEPPLSVTPVDKERVLVRHVRSYEIIPLPK